MVDEIVIGYLTAKTLLIIKILNRHTKFEGSRPEWCISSMIYNRYIPFWSETLEIWTELTVPS